MRARLLVAVLCVACGPSVEIVRVPAGDNRASATPSATRPEPRAHERDVGVAVAPDRDGMNPPGTTLTAESAFTDPSPPRGWLQCAGFVNTAADDVSAGFLDNCLDSPRLRVRVFRLDGELEEDVFVVDISQAPSWPSGGYLHGRTTVVKKSFWGDTSGGASSAFFTQTNGTDACGQFVARAGTTLGSGHAETAIIAGGATGYDEYRVSCGKPALPDRKIALYR